MAREKPVTVSRYTTIGYDANIWRPMSDDSKARPGTVTDGHGALRERVLAAVDEDRLVQTLQRMVRQPSHPRTPGEGELALLLGDLLRGRGLEVELQELSPGRYNTLGWLRGGGGGRSLMLNGHIDTNPAGEGWTRDPFGGDVEDGFIYGIGVSNMKAADAAMIEAATAVAQVGADLRGDLCVALVCGEILGGEGSAHMMRSGTRTDHFIVGEPTDLSILTLHAGPIELWINVIGRMRHMTRAEESVSAIDKMYKVIERLKTMQLSHADEPKYASLNQWCIGAIRGGMSREYVDWQPSMVPDFCTIKVAGRLAPTQTDETVVADVIDALTDLRSHDPDLEFEVTKNPTKEFMAPFEVSVDDPFVLRLVQTHQEVTGVPARVGDIAPYRIYGTDAGHIVRHDPKAIGVVCGPGGKYNTMPDEKVEIDELVSAAKIYALSILDVCS
ncbi:M20 family metallopeptidase [Solwaraspora sp. WMMB335]|uniref:M20 family metallopeptidase n=1 Tax=Solwaraspora sp. WMMB335 TaxID=3404118 RepID=UPI003B96579A